MKSLPSIQDFVPVTTIHSIKMEIKSRFRLRRKEQRISQQALSKRSGVSYGSIRRFENSGEISLTSLLKISQAIGLLEEFNPLLKQPLIKNLKDFK